MNRFLTITVFSVTFALLALAPVRAQHFPPADSLQTLIQSRLDEQDIKGIVLGVLEPDGSSVVVSAGDAGQDARPLSGKSVFEIGSITKAFTGILLADMVARGEVTLDDPASNFLPGHVTMPSRHGMEITLLDLATHYSSLPRLPDNMAPADPLNPYADYTVEQMYAFLSGHELQSDVSTVYEYSNLGVGLLGHVLSLVGGGTYEEVIRERVLGPLGMEMTGVSLTDEMEEWMARGHSAVGESVPLWDLPAIAGAGALRSNAEDLLRFLAACTRSPESDLDSAIVDSRQSQRRVDEATEVGLGWHIRRADEDRIVFHGGGTGGFRTFIGFDPATRAGLVLLTNSVFDTDDLAFHLINPEMPLAERREDIEVANEILETYVGEYQLMPEFSFVVTLNEGSLFGQATGQPVIGMFAASETEFFLRVVDAQIEFHSDDSGTVTGVTINQNGAVLTGDKVR